MLYFSPKCTGFDGAVQRAEQCSLSLTLLWGYAQLDKLKSSDVELEKKLNLLIGALLLFFILRKKPRSTFSAVKL